MASNRKWRKRKI